MGNLIIVWSWLLLFQCSFLFKLICFTKGIIWYEGTIREKNLSILQNSTPQTGERKVCPRNCEPFPIPQWLVLEKMAMWVVFVISMSFSNAWHIMFWIMGILFLSFHLWMIWGSVIYCNISFTSRSVIIMIMKVTVALDTWPGGLKQFREALPKIGEHPLKVPLLNYCACNDQNGWKRSNLVHTLLVQSIIWQSDKFRSVMSVCNCMWF